MVKLGMRTTVLPGMNIVELVLVLVLVLVVVEQESSLVR
jgi:hypothetical protein